MMLDARCPFPISVEIVKWTFLSEKREAQGIIIKRYIEVRISISMLGYVHGCCMYKGLCYQSRIRPNSALHLHPRPPFSVRLRSLDGDQFFPLAEISPTSNLEFLM
jgi:hypothetical protein